MDRKPKPGTSASERVKTLLNGEGESLLRESIEGEIAAQGKDPHQEMRQARACQRLRESV